MCIEVHQHVVVGHGSGACVGAPAELVKEPASRPRANLVSNGFNTSLARTHERRADLGRTAQELVATLEARALASEIALVLARQIEVTRIHVGLPKYLMIVRASSRAWVQDTFDLLLPFLQ